jgi:SsrA-binding protein
MKNLAENKKAYYNYEILEKIEAGIALNGQEVKSIKLGRANLQGSFIIIKDEQPRLLGAKVPAYQPKNAPADYDPERTRALLLKKAEIKKLIGKTAQKGLTLVPLKLYTKRGKVKIEIALVKSKSKPDKREQIKKRDIQREMERELFKANGRG